MRVFGHYLLESRVRLFVAEQAAAGVLFLAALAGGSLSGAGAVAAAAACVLALQAALYLADLYALSPETEPPAGRWLFACGLGTLGAAALWGAAGLLRPGQALEPRAGLLFVALALASLVVLLLRGLPLVRTRRVLVLGTGAPARKVAELLQSSELSDWSLCGFVDDDEQADGPVPQPLALGRAHTVDEIARVVKADVLVVATRAVPEEALARARAAGVRVTSAAGFAARTLRRLPPELLGPGELAFGEGFAARRLSDVLQRVLDVTASLTLLALSSPVLLLAMLAVRLDSPGPIFYSQERTGRGGRTYRITKLRTMRQDAEAAGVPQWAQAGDARVTRVGRWLRRSRVDELPQLFAVLRGDMSVVGPRPERPFFVDQLAAQLPLYGLRAAVRPGVTGWAQINYPYGATVEDARNKLEYDLYYVRHRSFFLNLVILFHTARTVLTGKGAR